MKDFESYKLPVLRPGGIWAKPLEGCFKVMMNWFVDFVVTRRPSVARSIIQRYSESYSLAIHFQGVGVQQTLVRYVEGNSIVIPLWTR